MSNSDIYTVEGSPETFSDVRAAMVHADIVARRMQRSVKIFRNGEFYRLKRY